MGPTISGSNRALPSRSRSGPDRDRLGSARLLPLIVGPMLPRGVGEEAQQDLLVPQRGLRHCRSEKRRGGEEGRTRGAPDHLNKKKEGDAVGLKLIKKRKIEREKIAGRDV